MTHALKEESGFDSDFHVYEPHRVGLPRLTPYITELWRRREFAAELSRSGMRAAHSNTFFGQIWLVLNPLLLALVYYVLVSILAGVGGLEYLVHLVAGLFAFYFVSGCVSTGAASVIGGGRLVMNMAFPRLLMPYSAVRTAFFRFLPTMIVYFAFHILGGLPWSWTMLLALVFLGLMVIFGLGAAAIFATVQVYFRDAASFLPYFIRIWLYLSPVLWFPEDAPEAFKPFMFLNPLYSLLGGWTDLLVRGQVPELSIWVASAIWSVVVLVAGSLFFMSREREFAVRL
jgi:ABC-type polysaccharide/polyol phosphate export permease